MPEVDLKIMLPNQICKTLKIDRSLQTSVVLRQILEGLNIDSKYHCHFGLFETIENTFERKLSPEECPFAVYVANFSTASATCIILKPFVFSIQLMQSLVADDLKILDLTFHQVKFFHVKSFFLWSLENSTKFCYIFLNRLCEMLIWVESKLLKVLAS